MEPPGVMAEQRATIRRIEGDASRDGGRSRAAGAETRPPNELRALSGLVFEDLSALPGAIRDMHLGIAERAFKGVGPASRPVRVIHDAVSRRAYDASPQLRRWPDGLSTRP